MQRRTLLLQRRTLLLQRRTLLLQRRTLLTLAALTLACDTTSRKRSGESIRVVSLSPNTTEAMFAIGAGDLLVGRSKQCDFPAEAQRLTSIGDYAAPNLEAIIALRPSLVIGEQGPVGPQIESKLRAHGTDTFFPATDGVADITAMLRKLGTRVNRSQPARRVAQTIDTRIAQLTQWAHPRDRVNVVMVFDVSPIYVAGPGSFPDELLRLAGGTNMITRGGKWPTIDIEHLVRLNPAVVIDAMGVGHAETSRVGTAPGWHALTAVKERRVRRLTSSAALRPGPRIADGLVDVARAVHGERPKG